MNSMTKLSFIIPVFNVEKYLAKCLDSILVGNSFTGQVICVNDGSTDGSAAIIEQYAKKYPNVEIITQPNAGLSAARNVGVQTATGEYICFVDSDDYWEPNVLGELMEQIGREKLDVLRFKHQHVRVVNSEELIVNSGETKHLEYEVFNPYKQSPYRDDDYSSEVTDGISFLNTRLGIGCYAWAFIIRRSLLVDSVKCTVYGDNCLFTEGIYFEDTDWTPRMLARAQRVASTDTIVYNYLVRQGSITKAVDRNKQRKVLEDKMRLIGELRRQADELKAQECDHRWYQRMIAETVISIINILSTTFYLERKQYLERLRELRVFPISLRGMKVRLINFSPRLATELLYLKNR